MTCEPAPRITRLGRGPAAPLLLLLLLLLLVPFGPPWQEVAGASPPDGEQQEPGSSHPAERVDAPVDRSGDMVSIFGGDLVVPAGTRQRGDLVCIGCRAVIAGEVDGDVVVVLGTVMIAGRVDGDATAVLSDSTLDGATISGELVNVLGAIEMRDSRVAEEFLNLLGSMDQDSASSRPNFTLGFQSWNFWSLLLWARLISKFFVFVLVLLLVAVVPERVRAIGEQAPVRYGSAFLVGLLGYIGLMLVLALPFIGFPFGLVAFWVFKWLGIAGVFYAVGRSLGRVFGREMSLLGAVLLVFALYLVMALAPMLLGITGFLLWGTMALLFFFLVEVPAVGLVILTRAGGRYRTDLAAPTAGTQVGWTASAPSAPPQP